MGYRLLLQHRCGGVENASCHDVFVQSTLLCCMLPEGNVNMADKHASIKQRHISASQSQKREAAHDVVMKKMSFGGW